MYLYEIDYSRWRVLYATELAELSKPRREARLFQKAVEQYPLHIHRGDVLAGWYGFSSEEEQESIYGSVEAGVYASILPEPPCEGKTPRQ